MERFQIYFFTALFLAVLFLSFQIFWPFLVPLSIAATFAVLFHPLYGRVARLMGGRRGLAAFFTVVLVAIIIILPLAFVGKVVLQEAVEFSAQLNAGGTENISNALFSLQERVGDYFPGFSLNIDEYLRLAGNWLSENI